MSSDGWIKLHRRIQEDRIWTSEPFSRGQAWIDLLLLANHSNGYIRIQGMKIDVNRGDVGWSEIKLAERWKWSRGRVRRFLDELKTHHMIDKKSDHKTDKRKFVITILNYNKYQERKAGDSTSDSTSDSTGNGQATVQATVQEQECKEGKERNTPAQEYSQNFEKFWKEYPRKEGKAKAFSSWKKYKCDNGLFEKIMESLSQQKESKGWNKDGGKWIPQGGTWVADKRWEDEGTKTGDSEWQ